MSNNDAWLDQLKKDLDEIQPKAPVPATHKPNADSLLIALAFIMVFLFVAIVVVAQHKREPYLPPSVVTNDEKIDWLIRKASEHGDKITLLGIVMNNNEAIAKANDKSRYKDCYMYLNHDWTVNRMPSPMVVNMDKYPDSKALLEKYYPHY